MTHKLKVGDNDKLELYDYPGGYAGRFDGVDKRGGDQAAELQKIFEDNTRTVGIRMQEEALAGLLIRGKGGHCRSSRRAHVRPRRGTTRDDGKYVLTSVEHDARQAACRWTRWMADSATPTRSPASRRRCRTGPRA